MTRSVREVQDSGRLVILDDGSKWEVSSFDSFHTRMWLPLDRVDEKLGKLVNTSRNQAVDARRRF